MDEDVPTTADTVTPPSPRKPRAVATKLLDDATGHRVTAFLELPRSTVGRRHLWKDPPPGVLLVTKIDSLTGLRLFAALAVFMAHVEPPHRVSEGPVAVFIRSGYVGVTLFFVLSGSC